MKKPNFLQNIAEQLSDALPSHMQSLKNDFEKNCQTILKKGLNKFDLVTREEFDVQTKVLARTRKKLETLEKKLAHLEESLAKKSGKK